MNQPADNNDAAVAASEAADVAAFEYESRISDVLNMLGHVVERLQRMFPGLIPLDTSRYRDCVSWMDAVMYSLLEVGPESEGEAQQLYGLYGSRNYVADWYPRSDLADGSLRTLQTTLSGWLDSNAPDLSTAAGRRQLVFDIVDMASEVVAFLRDRRGVDTACVGQASFPTWVIWWREALHGDHESLVASCPDRCLPSRDRLWAWCEQPWVMEFQNSVETLSTELSLWLVECGQDEAAEHSSHGADYAEESSLTAEESRPLAHPFPVTDFDAGPLTDQAVHTDASDDASLDARRRQQAAGFTARAQALLSARHAAAPTPHASLTFPAPVPFGQAEQRTPIHNREAEIGMVVRLRSGGPNMTVIRVDENARPAPGRTVRCAFFSHDASFSEVELVQGALDEITPVDMSQFYRGVGEPYTPDPGPSTGDPVLPPAAPPARSLRRLQFPEAAADGQTG